MNVLLDTLNPEQREAVLHFEGPLLVLAGAGSGKTRVLTTRVAWLVNEYGVDPSGILAVTFTNKAAGEMRARIRVLLGREPAGMWIGTFHAIGARLLRRHAGVLGWTPSFTIYDADQAERQVKAALERLGHSPKRWNPKAVHSVISGAKNQYMTPAQFARTAIDPFNRVVAEVYPDYQKALKDQNAFDFDDLLVKPVELLEASPELLERYRARFQFVLVDEYQDTNHVQYRLVGMLAREHQNLMVVGDDDQSIYRWRGADIRNILEFEQDFPEAVVVRLEENYRSTGRILDAANAVIAQNVKRKGKTLRTQAGPGDIITIVETADERDEAEWIVTEMETRMTEPEVGPRDFTVLYRTNSQSRALEEALRRHDLPYQIVGGTRFYERREIMDVLAYLRLISNPRDNGALDRIINYPRRGIGDVTRTRLMEWAAEQSITPLEAAERAVEIDAIGPAATRSLREFGGLIRRYAALAAHVGVGELLQKLIAEIGLVQALQDEGPDGEDRVDNVAELVAGANEFDAGGVPGWDDEEDVPDATMLDQFLQKVALVADVDRHDPQVDAITLMTVHNAKGLEFPVVFISGMEDGLFPLSRSFDEPDALEEERRLFYVGITRAERKLYVTHARMRRRGGEFLPCIPSSFLEPIPPGLTEARATSSVLATRRRSAGWRDGGGWGSGGGGRGAGGYRSERRRQREQERASEPEGLVVDYSYGDSDDAPRFVKGERVHHPQFGSGVIRELSGFGPSTKAVIDFGSVGRKKVVLRYANLQKEL